MFIPELAPSLFFLTPFPGGSVAKFYKIHFAGSI